MVKLSKSGAKIIPPMPGWYACPNDLDEMIMRDDKKNKELPDDIELKVWNDESKYLKGRIDLLLKNAWNILI